MKINEAPEKIILSADRETGTLYDEWVIKDLTDNIKIEYVRKDTFIEKAVKYFHRGLEDTKVIDDYRNILVPGIQASYTSVEEFIENFKKYIEE